MKATLLPLLLLLCLNVFGQEQGNIVEGKIIDENNLAIPGVTVKLIGDGDKPLTLIATTDDSGAYHFEIVKNGIYYIKVNAIGFVFFNGQPLIVKDNGQLRLPIVKLLAANSHLKEVVVQAPPKALIEQQIDRTVINTSALLSNTGVSAVDVLNNSPGVEITEDGISLRNKTGVSIYVDGRQVMLNGQDLISYLNALPSSLIDKIELMPNPPASYHSDGGGVINIITKKNKTNGFSGNVSVGATQAHYFNSDDNVNLNYKTNKVNVYFTAAYRRNILDYHVVQQRDYFNAGALLAQTNAEVDNTNSYRGRLGIDYQKDSNNSFGLQLDGFNGPYHERGNYLLQFNHQLPDSAIHTQSSLVKATHNVGANLNYRHRFDKKESYLTVNADYLNYYDRAVQNINSQTYLPSGAVPLSSYALDTDNPFSAVFYSLKADYETTLSKVKVSSGVQGNYSSRNSNGNYSDGTGRQIDSLTTSQRADEKTGAAYLLLNRDFKRLTIQAGLRFEATSSSSNQFNAAGRQLAIQVFNYDNLLPSVFLAYLLDSVSRRSILFSFNTRVDRPGYAALNPFVFYFDKYSSIQGNPELQPARNVNLELSFNTGANITIGSRFNLTNNPIIQYFRVSGESLINTNVNIGRQTNFALFTNFSFSPAAWWMLNGYEELYQQKFSGPVSTTGEAFENQLLSFRLQLSSQFKLQKGWSTEIGGFYNSKNTFGQGYTRPYGRLNASLQKKLFNGKGALIFSGTDILHSNIIRRDILLDGADFIRRNSYDSQRFSLTFTYNFGATYKKQASRSGLENERSRVGAN